MTQRIRGGGGGKIAGFQGVLIKRGELVSAALPADKLPKLVSDYQDGAYSLYLNANEYDFSQLVL